MTLSTGDNGETQRRGAAPPLVVLGGVSGSGKTTVGRRLASVLAVPFVDADDFHPASNVAKMRRDEPLTDADREPWLRALNDELQRRRHDGMVLACSALTSAGRRRLVSGFEPGDVRFVFLRVAVAELRRRLSLRGGHFMGPALLDSQLQVLEEPLDAPVVDGERPPGEVVEAVVAALDLSAVNRSSAGGDRDDPG